MNLGGWLRSTFLGLGPRDVAVTGALFRDASPEIRARLEAVVEAFVAGYNLAMSCDTVTDLATSLEQYEHERRGFAYEGAGMGAAIRVMITPGSTVLADYLHGPGDPHHYMILVGAGWAMARVPVRHALVKAQLRSDYHWLVYDGWAFHEVMFHKDRVVDRMESRPAEGYAARAWDQGLGRALWFAECATPSRIAATIGRFPADRHADLWGGAGLAATYAGGVSDETLLDFVREAGPHVHRAGVGSALALLARQRAGNPVPHNVRAVGIITGWTPEEAAKNVDEAVANAGAGDEHYPRMRDDLADRIAANLAARAAQ